MSRRSATILQFLILSLLLALLLMLALWITVHGNLLWLWLVSINLVSLGVYRYDKAISPTQWTRVPEPVLHALTLLGGALGSAIAIWGFRERHKTKTPEFLRTFWAIVLVQLALVTLILIFATKGFF